MDGWSIFRSRPFWGWPFILLVDFMKRKLKLETRLKLFFILWKCVQKYFSIKCNTPKCKTLKNHPSLTQTKSHFPKTLAGNNFEVMTSSHVFLISTTRFNMSESSLSVGCREDLEWINEWMDAIYWKKIMSIDICTWWN